MQSKAKTPLEYIESLPADRREAISEIRKVILKNLPKGYQEGMQYGMIGYFVPHSVYPDGYHCNPKEPLPFAGVASQKNHMSLYMMCNYGDEKHKDWFVKAWTKTGRKLDMGKSCVRFKKLEDVPLDVLGEAIRRVPVKEYIAFYESALAPTGAGRKRAAAKKKTKKKAAKKSTRKAVRKKAKTSAKKSARKTTRKAAKKTAKKRARRA